jgi:hypothetical protein
MKPVFLPIFLACFSTIGVDKINSGQFVLIKIHWVMDLILGVESSKLKIFTEVQLE